MLIENGLAMLKFNNSSMTQQKKMEFHVIYHQADFFDRFYGVGLSQTDSVALSFFRKPWVFLKIFEFYLKILNISLKICEFSAKFIKKTLEILLFYHKIS